MATDAAIRRNLGVYVHYQTARSAIAWLPVFFLYGGPLAITGSATLLALLVFVAAGVIESLLYFHLIRKTGGVLVSFGSFVALFAGIGWGMLLFSERHGQAVWAAAGVLCLAPALVGRDKAVRPGEA